MPEISTEDSGILQLTKNAKTNNNIADYHFVSRRVVPHPQMFSMCMDAPKVSSYYPENIMFQFQICYHSYLNVS